MTMLRHGQFIANMAKYKMAGTWEAYRERHANDPQVPALGEETHDAVCKLGAVIDMSSPEAIRESLCAKFRAGPESGKINVWDKGIRRSAIKKAMNISGLKWFELDGNPMIHWNEKP